MRLRLTPLVDIQGGHLQKHASDYIVTIAWQDSNESGAFASDGKVFQLMISGP